MGGVKCTLEEWLEESSRSQLIKGLEEHGKKLRFDSKLDEWVANKEFYTKEG